MSTRTPKRRVLIITGSRSEYGLLRPVMQAVRKHKKLRLLVAVAGEHLLAPAQTWKEVAAEFRVDAKAPMQRRTDRGRLDHAAATARGMAGFAAAYRELRPDWVVVLGDRIEAFAAASAASIAGIAVCHIHGGDRAEGIADEAMRHAITKLAHLHCVATRTSAERVLKLGEPAGSVCITGSPGIDGIDRVRPLDDHRFAALGSPRAVVLLHPWAAPRAQIAAVTEEIAALLLLLCSKGSSSRVLWLSPNSDPGFDVIRRVVERFGVAAASGRLGHIPRDQFLSLLRRLAVRPPRGVLVGNSSAGLIEAAAIGLTAVNIGDRQAGRERADNVLDVAIEPDLERFDERFGLALEAALRHRSKPTGLFGDGRAGPRIAALLAKTDPHEPALLRKRNSY